MFAGGSDVDRANPSCSPWLPSPANMVTAVTQRNAIVHASEWAARPLVLSRRHPAHTVAVNQLVDVAAHPHSQIVH